MKRMSQAFIDIKNNLKNVHSKIDLTYQQISQTQPIKPRLVAVSKTQPNEIIRDAYIAGQRIFGENYIQELEEKGKSLLLLESCPDIKWHFIGRLQSNKVKRLLAVNNLDMIETISSQKLAKEVNSQFGKLSNGDRCMKVMLQVNTSNEEQKGGCVPLEAPSIARFIKEECPLLNLVGIMTIGAYPTSDSSTNNSNPDFQGALQCRQRVCQELGLPETQLEVSMGMSADFEEAIRMGSTNVRVGSTIFGARKYPVKPETKEETTQ